METTDLPREDQHIDSIGRRGFMKRFFMAGAGGMFLLAAGPASDRAETQAEKPAEDPEKGFSKEWIVGAVGNMEAHLPENETIGVLEECGRRCARRGAVKMAVGCAGDIDKLLAGMRGWIGESNVRREGEKITLVYGKCYCPNVRDVEKVPASYCNCSRGWVREMFETVTGKPCDVALLASIKRGDPECRFVVRV
jgi:predicted hydrocarbon binding protein